MGRISTGTAWLGVAATLSVAVPGSAQADPKTARELLSECTGEKGSNKIEGMAWGVACASYFTGANDMLRLMTEIVAPDFYCPGSEGVSASQGLRAFARWAQQHPNALDMPARVAIASALKEAYPCDSSDSPNADACGQCKINEVCAADYGCTPYCKSNDECNTGCCAELENGQRACGPSSLCPNIGDEDNGADKNDDEAPVSAPSEFAGAPAPAGDSHLETLGGDATNRCKFGTEPATEGSRAPPLVPVRTLTDTNSAGTTELTLALRNQADTAIDGFKVLFYLYDSFNDPVTRRSAERGTGGMCNVLAGRADGKHIGAHEGEVVGMWHASAGASKALAVITDVHFTNNETWQGLAIQERDPREPD